MPTRKDFGIPFSTLFNASLTTLSHRITTYPTGFGGGCSRTKFLLWKIWIDGKLRLSCRVERRSSCCHGVVHFDALLLASRKIRNISRDLRYNCCLFYIVCRRKAKMLLEGSGHAAISAHTDPGQKRRQIAVVILIVPGLTSTLASPASSGVPL